MDRAIAVSMAVLFAVSACDSEPTDGDQSPSTERRALEDRPADAGTHRTRTGLAFDAPSDWSTKLMPAGAQLIPPDGPDTRDSYLLAIRFAPDDTGDATDGAYVDRLARDFTDRISDATVVARETGLDNPIGPASYVAWNIPQEGWVKRVGFYVAISDPWMLVLRATGPRSLVEQRRDALESIFASAKLTDADTVPKLVGTWRRTEPRQTERGPFEQTMILEADGTLRLSHKPDGDTDLEPLEDVGRWAATEQKFIQYAGNQLEGGVQLQTRSWNLDGSDGTLRLEGSDASGEWRRIE